MRLECKDIMPKIVMSLKPRSTPAPEEDKCSPREVAVRNPEEKRLVLRPRVRLGNDVEMDFKNN
jgi:hypothetical protein